ncbi:MAG: NAD-dependent epimerase/dehydratase family protein, partial [Alphaproteobacteria bacterium]|nr:NAD-dependent epimerase/dehydratase family protein [Alphaproteobacteria bacterium]
MPVGPCHPGDVEGEEHYPPELGRGERRGARYRDLHGTASPRDNIKRSGGRDPAGGPGADPHTYEGPGGMPVRILVAGGAGFIGGHLSESMCGEHNLTIVSRSPKTPGMAGLGVRTIPCDVADGPAISGVIKEVEPEMIIHLAGGTSHARSFEDPSADLDVNARSTLHMLEGIRRADLECRLVLGSTFIVVGRPESLPVDEGSTCNPATPYAAHRLLAEHYCRIYANVYGMDTGVFRITNS